LAYETVNQCSCTEPTEDTQPSVDQGHSDVTPMKEAESTTPEPQEVIYVTSPVYEPITMEDSDADTETESTLSDVITSTTTQDQSQSSTTTTTTTTAPAAVIELTTELGHQGNYSNYPKHKTLSW